MIGGGGEGRGLPAQAFTRAVAVAGAVSFVGFGVWAMVAPRSFFGRVATFEPYNQHLIQDIGAFQIGLGSVLLLAVQFRGAGALAVALLGTGIGGGAHVASHVVGRDLGGRPEVDIPVFAVLAALLVAAGVFSWPAGRSHHPGGGSAVGHPGGHGHP